jgi:VIT1/CCC1 family predicted Fe2+/Mn2+ transporter
VTAEHYEEHHRSLTSGWARAAVFGASDGLVTNVSLILGFAGASPGHSVVRLAGIAGLVSGAFSMASGEYLSVRSQRELMEREIDVERRAIEANPVEEEAELQQIFEQRGIEPELATRLAADLMRNPDLALRTHAREELGIDPSNTGSPWTAAFWSLITFSMGALLPLLPWLFTSSGNPIWWSVGFGAVGSFGVGAIVGKFSERGVIRTAIRQLFVTSISAAITYSVGKGVGSH